MHVVWTEDDQVYHGQSTEGVLWDYAAIAAGSGPTLSAGREGAVLVAWQNEEFADYEIYSSKLEGPSWSPPVNVSDSPDADSTAPDVTVQANGTAHLVWQEAISATAYVRYSQGSDWTETITLSDGVTDAYLPSLAVDAWGRQHAAWEDFDFPHYRIRYTWAHGPGSIWQQAATLAQGASPSQQLEEVSLYPGPDGVVHAVWVETEGGQGEILYASKRFYQVFLPVTLRQVGG
jgi:hypothetical protein